MSVALLILAAALAGAGLATVCLYLGLRAIFGSEMLP